MVRGNQFSIGSVLENISENSVWNKQFKAIYTDNRERFVTVFYYEQQHYSAVITNNRTEYTSKVYSKV